MPTLRSHLNALANDFASTVLDAIRGVSLEDLVAGAQSDAGNEQRVSKATPTSPRPRARKSGRLSRRSAEDIAEALNKVVVLVKRHKDGLRAEQIRAELRMRPNEMPRVLKEGLAKRKLRSKGQKRATTYFAK